MNHYCSQLDFVFLFISLTINPVLYSDCEDNLAAAFRCVLEILSGMSVCESDCTVLYNTVHEGGHCWQKDCCNVSVLQ